LNKNLFALICAFIAGSIFAIGLVISGMTQPTKVQGFLNVGGIFDAARFGAWDASLAFVMGGALLVTLVAFAVTPKLSNRPWFAPQFELPALKNIDRPLLIGAALFGVGWAMAGYCPGPALATVALGQTPTLLFVVAMLLGMWVARKFVK
jgi:uncharacterized protein